MNYIRTDQILYSPTPKILLKQSIFVKVLLLEVHSLPAVQPFSMENKRKTNTFLARFVSQFKRKFNLKFDPHALVILAWEEMTRTKSLHFYLLPLQFLFQHVPFFPVLVSFHICLIITLLNSFSLVKFIRQLALQRTTGDE